MRPSNILTSSSRIFHVQAADCRFRVKGILPSSPIPVDGTPTLIFLHEGLGCIELWRDFPETLCTAAGCPGIIYDRKGYGGSDDYGGPWPLNYLEIESQIYLPELMKVCNLNDAVLIGHSDGGTIALLTAAALGEQVRAVITEAAHIFVELVTLAGIRKAIEAFETTDLKQRLARYHGDNTETIFRRWADRWLSSSFYDWNIEHELPQITCPPLVLQGADDEYGTAAQVEGIARLVSGPVTVKLLPDCGHVPHFQARDRVLKEMAKFIKALNPNN